MSVKHATVEKYWQSASKGLDQWIAEHGDRDAEELLVYATAIFAYTMEDVQQKVTRNQTMAPKLLSLMVLGFDLLRGAVAAQQHQSLAMAAVCGRTLWEAMVKMVFIKESKTPDLYADRFVRFALLENLKRHYSGRIPLPPHQVAGLTAECAEWIDPKTNQPKKHCEWTGEDITIKKQAALADGSQLYETYYSIGSMFTHGASIAQRFYMVGTNLQTIAQPKLIRSQSVLAAASAIKLVSAYAEFFGIPLPLPEVKAFHLKTQHLLKP
jgi:Family of unknown function (DUF5677)